MRKVCNDKTIQKIVAIFKYALSVHSKEVYTQCSLVFETCMYIFTVLL